VENSAASPASIVMVRSPSSSTIVPDKTVNQSLPGWTFNSSVPRRGSGLATTHLGDGHAVRAVLPTEHPGGHSSRRVVLRPDHHVVVGDTLDQLVERVAQGPGDRAQLVEADPPVARLDPAQG